MKTLPIGPFLGLNNRLPDTALTTEHGTWLKEAVNVDIDNAGRVPGYREAADGVDDDDGDQHFWRGFDRQSREVKSELESRYGCNVVSINPFINLNLEGHRWHSFAGTLNG